MFFAVVNVTDIVVPVVVVCLVVVVGLEDVGVVMVNFVVLLVMVEL